MAKLLSDSNFLRTNVHPIVSQGIGIALCNTAQPYNAFRPVNIIIVDTLDISYILAYYVQTLYLYTRIFQVSIRNSSLGISMDQYRTCFCIHLRIFLFLILYRESKAFVVITVQNVRIVFMRYHPSALDPANGILKSCLLQRSTNLPVSTQSNDFFTRTNGNFQPLEFA